MVDISGLKNKRLGRYQLEDLIGRGGMSTVYLAHDSRLDRHVALKVMASDLTADASSSIRFAQEAKIVARLQHPNIVHVYDYGEEKELYYIVMQMLTGGSLGNLLSQRICTLNETADLLDAIASALDYAHIHSVIHRDIKPSNVLFDDRQNAHLADFGVAKILNISSTLTLSGRIVGTPSFMAPELWRDEEASPQSDIYALGVLIYQTLSGVAPFEAASPMALMLKHLNETPPLLSQHNPQVSSNMDATIRTALEKHRSNRYPTAADFASDFRRAVQAATASHQLAFRPQGNHQQNQPTNQTPEQPDAELTALPVLPESSDDRSTEFLSPAQPLKNDRQGIFRLFGLMGTIAAVLLGLMIIGEIIKPPTPPLPTVARPQPTPIAAVSPTAPAGVPSLVATPNTLSSQVTSTASIRSALATPGLTIIPGTLSAQQPAHELRFDWQAGTIISICVASQVFDTNLKIYAPDGSVASNDDFNHRANSCIPHYVVPMTGQYRVLIGSVNDRTGAYSLNLTDFSACGTELPIVIVQSEADLNGAIPLVKERPYTFSATIVSALSNECFPLIGRSETDGWWQIRTADGHTGWIIAGLVNIVGSTEDVPVRAG